MIELMNYWYVLVAILCVGMAVGVRLYKFLVLPDDEKMSNIKQWLLWAVVKAETELGRDTGKVKLMYVYDLFIQRFPTVAKIVTFEMFHEWVNKALDEMADLLDESPNLLNYVQTGEAIYENLSEDGES